MRRRRFLCVWIATRAPRDMRSASRRDEEIRARDRRAAHRDMRRALELERIAGAATPSLMREEATIQIRIADRDVSGRDDDYESGRRSVDVRVFEGSGSESEESMVLTESAHKTFENAAHEALECYDLLLEQGHMNEHAYNQTCIQLRNLNQTRNDGTSSARRQIGRAHV